MKEYVISTENKVDFLNRFSIGMFNTDIYINLLAINCYKDFDNLIKDIRLVEFLNNEKTKVSKKGLNPNFDILIGQIIKLIPDNNLSIGSADYIKSGQGLFFISDDLLTKIIYYSNRIKKTINYPAIDIQLVETLNKDLAKEIIRFEYDGGHGGTKTVRVREFVNKNGVISLLANDVNCDLKIKKYLISKIPDGKVLICD